MENKAAEGSYVTSKTSVWWDIDSCPVPAGYDPSLVGPSIHLALEKLGYRGPITITAVGKLKRTSEDVLRASHLFHWNYNILGFLYRRKKRK
ncbi:unnamed protein product [Microthlaspi erraticum]|uniref:NYN domain-containing protein n=1 Tax=Microthlaspi erraticum TaxID=1685480 RepID=A0A6D2L6B4_9BRAS|nr:unnamed protein product [Microthlaspi erraticum]